MEGQEWGDLSHSFQPTEGRALHSRSMLSAALDLAEKEQDTNRWERVSTEFKVKVQNSSRRGASHKETLPHETSVQLLQEELRLPKMGHLGKDLQTEWES